jgi:hypothetical protein
MIAARKKSTRIIEVAAVEDSGGLEWSAPELPERSGGGEMIADLPPAEVAKQIVAWLQARGVTS